MVNQIRLLVDGMRCRRCVREVTRRLRDVAGVQVVTANAAKTEVRLTGTVSVEEVLAAFRGTSYGPRLIGQQIGSGEVEP